MWSTTLYTPGEPQAECLAALRSDQLWTVRLTSHPSRGFRPKLLFQWEFLSDRPICQERGRGAQVCGARCLGAPGRIEP